MGNPQIDVSTVAVSDWLVLQTELSIQKNSSEEVPVILQLCGLVQIVDVPFLETMGRTSNKDQHLVKLLGTSQGLRRIVWDECLCVSNLGLNRRE